MTLSWGDVCLGIVCKKNFRGEVFGESVRERAGKMSGNVREELFVGMCEKISWGVSGGIVWGNVREKRLGMSEEIVRGNCPSGNMREKAWEMSGEIVREELSVGKCGENVWECREELFRGMCGENSWECLGKMGNCSGELSVGECAGNIPGECTGKCLGISGGIVRGMCEENTWGIVWGIVWGMSWSNVPGYVRIAMR